MPIQSTSCNVRLCVCVSVPPQNTLFGSLWRLLEESRPPITHFFIFFFLLFFFLYTKNEKIMQPLHKKYLKRKYLTYKIGKKKN